MKGHYDWARLPFTAQWRGEIDQPTPTPITLMYAGEGTLRIAGLADVPLPPVYQRRGTVTVTVPGGRRTFALDYRFDDGSRTIEGPIPPRRPVRDLARAGGDGAAADHRFAAGMARARRLVDLTIFAILGSLVGVSRGCSATTSRSPDLRSSAARCSPSIRR